MKDDKAERKRLAQAANQLPEKTDREKSIAARDKAMKGMGL